MGGEYVWQSSVLSRPVGFVVAVTAWWFAVVNLAPVFGTLLLAELGDPLLAELKADGVRSWLHGPSGAFTTSLIVIIIAAAAASLRLSTYARVQRILFAIGILAVGVCVVLLLTHSRVEFQRAFDREAADLYGANEGPFVTTLSSTPLDVRLREVQLGSTVLLVPLLALSLMLVAWGNPLTAEIRGITRGRGNFLAIAGAAVLSTLLALLLLLAIGKGMSWTFWNAENDDYWGAVYGYRTAPPLASWPSPIMQAGWLVESSAFQVGLLLAGGAWFVGWIGTLFLSSTRVLVAATTREGIAGRPTVRRPERVTMLLVLPAMAISALSAYWDAFARQTAAAVAIPFAVAGIASSLAALAVARNASRSVFAAAVVFAAFLALIVVRWIQSSVYAMGPGALAYVGALYVIAVVVYRATTSPARRGS
jgi:basic amino acid/polyamine antiporter, APA family